MDSDDAEVGRAADPILPMAPIDKLLKQELGSEMKAAADVAPLLQSYLGEFLVLLTTKANESAAGDKRNMITEAHILKALDELGFKHHSDNLRARSINAPSARKQGKGKRKRGGLPEGMTEEESLRLQQELFASAKAAFSQ